MSSVDKNSEAAQYGKYEPDYGKLADALRKENKKFILFRNTAKILKGVLNNPEAVLNMLASFRSVQAAPPSMEKLIQSHENLRIILDKKSILKKVFKEIYKENSPAVNSNLMAFDDVFANQKEALARAVNQGVLLKEIVFALRGDIEEFCKSSFDIIADDRDLLLNSDLSTNLQGILGKTKDLQKTLKETEKLNSKDLAKIGLQLKGLQGAFYSEVLRNSARNIQPNAREIWVEHYDFNIAPHTLSISDVAHDLDDAQWAKIAEKSDRLNGEFNKYIECRRLQMAVSSSVQKDGTILHFETPNFDRCFKFVSASAQLAETSRKLQAPLEKALTISPKTVNAAQLEKASIMLSGKVVEAKKIASEARNEFIEVCRAPDQDSAEIITRRLNCEQKLVYTEKALKAEFRELTGEESEPMPEE